MWSYGQAIWRYGYTRIWLYGGLYGVLEVRILKNQEGIQPMPQYTFNFRPVLNPLKVFFFNIFL